MPVDGITVAPNAGEPAALVIRNGRVHTGTPRDPPPQPSPLSWDSGPGWWTPSTGVSSPVSSSHLHVIRGGLNYLLELCWDGVPSLRTALWMLREQAGRTPKGQ